MGHNFALVLALLCGVVALVQCASVNAGDRSLARQKRQAYDPCTYRPCRNGGTCFKNRYGGYRCYCYAGFSGDHCQYSNSTNYFRNSTSGNTTNGNHTNGNSTYGNGYYYGNSTGGNSTNGNHTNGNSTYGNGYYYGNSTGGNTTNGNNTHGNSTFGNGYYYGNSTGGNSTNGNHTKGNSTLGRHPLFPGNGTGNGTHGNNTDSPIGDGYPWRYDPCLSRPCRNGGWCSTQTGGTYNCHCRPGFYGTNCELNQQQYIMEIWRRIMASFTQAGNIFGGR